MITEPDNSTIDTVVRILRQSRSILFITGAGVSADSGLPTYRGIGGLYDVDTTEEGYAIEEVLSAEMFARKPELTWKYLAQIGLSAQGATFNRGHEVIAEMESHFHRVWTLTQNVDGFHLDAGSKNVVEAHGNMNAFKCTRCDYHTVVENFADLELPPLCPDCGAMVRPDVVLFGELIQDRGIDELLQQMELGFDVVFSVGTTSVFPYIQEPIHHARRMMKPSIEINPCETVVSSHVDYRIAMSASDALNEIWKRYSEELE